MSRSRRTAFASLPALVILSCCPSLICAGVREPSMYDQPVDAIWKVQQLEFKYRSANVFYRCEALQAKIRNVLRTLGAYRSMAVHMRCPPREMVNHAVAQVTLAAPTEATVASIEAATTFDERARLAARVKKIALPTPNDIQHFPASWQTISIISLDPGDCELLRGMQEQLFPRLAIRPTAQMPRCSAFATKLRPRMEVMALMPMPAEDEVVAQD